MKSIFYGVHMVLVWLALWVCHVSANAWLPTDACPAEPIQYCTNQCFGTQAACANAALINGLGCQLTTCNVSAAVCMNKCVTFVTPCVLFSTPQLCLTRMSALTTCATADLAAACSTITPAIKALIICALCPRGTVADHVWNGAQTVAAISVVNDASGGQFLSDAVYMLKSSYYFDTILVFDQIVDPLSVMFPSRRFVSYNPVTFDRPNVRSLVFDAGPLGYLTCYACTLATKTGHIGVTSKGFSALTRQALMGCVAALRDGCPSCVLHAYPSPDLLRDPRVDSMVITSWADDTTVDLTNITFMAQQLDRPLTTTIPNVVFEPLSVIPSAFFAPFSATAQVVDHSFTSFYVPPTLSFASQLQTLYLRVTESYDFDYGAAAFDKMVNRTSNQITETLTMQPVKLTLGDPVPLNLSSSLRMSETVFLRFSQLNPFAIWLFSAGLNVLLQTLVQGTDAPSPRMRGAIASTTPDQINPSILTAYVVFGQNVSNSKRLGDIWQLQSEVGDHVRYRWSLFYSLESDTALVLPVERYGHSVTIVGDLMYMFGGVTRDVVRPTPVTNELWTFNLTSQQWRQLDSPALNARAFHKAVRVSASATTRFASGVTGTDFIFFAFGTLDKPTEAAISVLSLTTLQGAAFPMPQYPDGTPVFSNSSNNLNLCFGGRTDYVYVLGVCQNSTQNSTANYTVCKYSFATGRWGCQDVTNSDYGFDSTFRPPTCMVLLDSLIPERTSFLFLTDSGASVLTDIPRRCDADDDSDAPSPSPLGWECLLCPNGYDAINGVCVACTSSSNSTVCDEDAAKSNSPEIVVPVSVSVVVASVFVSVSVIVIVYRRSQKKQQRASNTDELVRDAVTAIATGFLEPVEYLYKMPRPSRLQRSLLSILRIFDVYAQFMPGWVFRGDRQANDFDNLAMFPGVSLSSASEPPHNWRHLRSRLNLHGNDVDATFSQSILSDSNNRELSTNIHGTEVEDRQTNATVSVDDEEVKQMLYRPRLVENNFYNADCTIMCVSFRLDWAGEQTLVANYDELLTRVYNIVDDAMGLIHSLVGDRLTVIFNGLIANEFHARDACTAACIMASTLAERVPSVPPVQMGIARGYVKVGIVSTSSKLLSTVIGDALERAQELLIANSTMNTNILCDWALAAFLGSGFAIRLLGFWRRNSQTAHKYLIAELKGMAQNEDAAVSVQVSLKQQNDGSSVLICSSDFTPLNELMIAIERKDDRQRDILIQKCRMTRRVPESIIKYLMKNNSIMVYSQENGPTEIGSLTLVP